MALVVSNSSLKSSLYLSEEYADVIFSFPHEGGYRIFAHRIFLIGNPVFRAMFTGPLYVDPFTPIEITDVSSAAYADFLQFFYKAKVQLDFMNIGAIAYLCEKYLMRDCLDNFISALINDVQQQHHYYDVNDLCAGFQITQQVGHINGAAFFGDVLVRHYSPLVIIGSETFRDFSPEDMERLILDAGALAWSPLEKMVMFAEWCLERTHRRLQKQPSIPPPTKLVRIPTFHEVLNDTVCYFLGPAFISIVRLLRPNEAERFFTSFPRALELIRGTIHSSPNASAIAAAAAATAIFNTDRAGESVVIPINSIDDDDNQNGNGGSGPINCDSNGSDGNGSANNGPINHYRNGNDGNGNDGNGNDGNGNDGNGNGDSDADDDVIRQYFLTTNLFDRTLLLNTQFVMPLRKPVVSVCLRRPRPDHSLFIFSTNRPCELTGFSVVPTLRANESGRVPATSAPLPLIGVAADVADHLTAATTAAKMEYKIFKSKWPKKMHLFFGQRNAVNLPLRAGSSVIFPQPEPIKAHTEYTIALFGLRNQITWGPSYSKKKTERDGDFLLHWHCENGYLINSLQFTMK